MLVKFYKKADIILYTWNCYILIMPQKLLQAELQMNSNPTFV